MKRALGLFVFAAVVAIDTVASAHTIIKSPPPIGGSADLKLAPCGCSFTPGSTNPCPASYPVTTLEAGSLVNVTWTETVNHDGMFRVAFSTTAPEQVTADELDAGVLWEGVDMNTTVPGDISEVVTIPDAPCDSCTLQVRQFMSGATNPYYFSCAAVRIVPAGTGGAGGTSSGNGPVTSAGPSTGAGTPSTAGSGSPVYMPQPNDGGCSTSPSRSEGGAAFAMLAIAIGLARGRRGAR